MLNEFSTELQKAAESKDIDTIIRMMRPRMTKHYESLAIKGGQYISGMATCDVVSEMEIKIWKTLDGYDSNKACYHTYITNILNNKYKDLLRKASNGSDSILNNAARLTESYEEEDVVYSYFGIDDSNLLQVENYLFIKSSLTDREQQAVSLVVSGYTRSEAASMMGVSPCRMTQLLGKVAEKWLGVDINHSEKSKQFKTNQKRRDSQ